MAVTIRYWFFAAFVIALANRNAGGLSKLAYTRQPALQIFRGALLAVEICVMVSVFELLGLIESHAVFASYPLLIVDLSRPILGEQVSGRSWIAASIGFISVVIILNPGSYVFSTSAVIPLLSAILFALYGLLTHRTARQDTAETSFFGLEQSA